MVAANARRLDAAEEPPPAFNASDANQWVETSQGIWLRQAKQLVAGCADPKQAVGCLSKLISVANDAIETVHFGVDVGDSEALSQQRNRFVSYYKSPIIGARKEDGLIASPIATPLLQEIYAHELNLGRPTQLIVPEDRDDLERIGTWNDFLSMLFWAEVQSLHVQQSELNNRVLFDASIASGPDVERRRLSAICDVAGHLVHTITAKDTSGRWARYFVYVPVDHEQPFLAALAASADKIIDLENYGKVLASHFLDRFRTEQADLARSKLQAIAERYANLSERQRLYSHESAGKQDDFKTKRFKSAMLDGGSRAALVNDLADHAAEQLAAASGAGGSKTDYIFPRGLSLEPSTVLLSVALERKLSLAQMRHVASLLVDPQASAVEAIISSICHVCDRLGTDAASFDRFMVLIAQNRSLWNAASLETAVNFATTDNHGPAFSISPIVAAAKGLAIGGLLGLGTAVTLMAVSSYRQKHTSVNWNELLVGLAWLDVVLHVSPEPDAILSSLRTYAEEKNALNLQRFFIAYQELSEWCWLKPSESATLLQNSLSLRMESSIVIRLVDLFIKGNLVDIERDFLESVLDGSFLFDVRSISIIGKVIEPKPHSQKAEALGALLANSLHEAFEAVNYPIDARPAMIEKMVDALLRPVEPRLPSFPQEAPVKWKDRRDGETAPEFTRRVYGVWAAQGIGKRDLRRVDVALLNALLAWTREGNDLPDDIKLLSVSDENRKLLGAGPDAINEHLSGFTGIEAAKEAARLRSASLRSR